MKVILPHEFEPAVCDSPWSGVCGWKRDHPFHEGKAGAPS